MNEAQRAGDSTGSGALEPRWPATLAVVVALVLYVALPAKLVLGPKLFIPALEVALLLILTFLSPKRSAAEARHIRVMAMLVIALVNLANIISVGLLVADLLSGTSGITGTTLVYSALSVWSTNVIVFGLWFWELDRGGPARRNQLPARFPDFLFPQMVAKDVAPPHWGPGFIDYMYVALTNATAFSPTDTMPLSRLSKSLMTAESLVSMITVVVVAARAINILR